MSCSASFISPSTLHLSCSSPSCSNTTTTTIFLKAPQTMDPNHSSSLVFSFKSAAANKKVMGEVEYDLEEVEEEEEEEEEEVEVESQMKKKRMNLADGSRKRVSTTSGGGGGGGGVAPPGCQAEKCGADLTDSKTYHKRHKVCEYHAKAQVVMVGGLRQRFCQQCSRFHELSQFDDAKRSCRRRLAGHNERRRKHFSLSRGEGSGRKGSGPQVKKDQCRQADEIGRTQLVFGETHQNFHIH